MLTQPEHVSLFKLCYVMTVSKGRIIQCQSQMNEYGALVECTLKGKPNYSHRNLSQCYSVHHIPLWLHQDLCVARNWSLTTTTMARQYNHLLNVPQIKISLKVFVESHWY